MEKEITNTTRLPESGTRIHLPNLELDVDAGTLEDYLSVWTHQYVGLRGREKGRKFLEMLLEEACRCTTND